MSFIKPMKAKLIIKAKQMVFMKPMKTKTQHPNEANGLHEA
ncbi:hypothetical protein [Bacillus xiapuensis]|uniref:Uncharacterized protein n=1 Tax=Bacillus xiapuensis TaxID=2014075 RepID=A0ABU6N7M1_9BACI|nr:hypothetical protein [Bacillus xiapuensis]